MVRCLLVLLLPHFRATSSHIFPHPAQNVIIVGEIDFQAFWDELIICALGVEKNYEHALDQAVHLSPLFGLDEPELFYYEDVAFSGS